MPLDAVLLAGGRGSRLGGADKPGLEIAGRTLLDRAVDATARCRTIVIVGPEHVLGQQNTSRSATVLWAREDPPFAGPAAALSAGFTELRARAETSASDAVVVLATDLPSVSAAHIDDLVRRLDVGDVDAVFARDAEGALQYLVGVWRPVALARSLDGDLSGRSMRSLVPESWAALDVDGTDDIDTADDLARVRSATGDDSARLSVAAARNRIRTEIGELAARTVPTMDAVGGTLADHLVAAESCPRFDASAMDGYAVSGAGPWTLRTDVVLAGDVGDSGPLDRGTAVRIATGAVVPPGTDRVLRDEFSLVSNSRVSNSRVSNSRVSSGSRLEQRPETPVREDIRRAGEDWSVGDPLAGPGAAVTPAVVSAALSAGVSELTVRGPAGASIVITGTEVAVGSMPLGRNRIRDAIGPVLPHFLEVCGFRVAHTEHTADTDFGLDAIFETEQVADVLFVVGATGGGAADSLRDALTRARARIVVGRVACRPGGGALVAVLGSGRVVVGLPGNPFAAIAAALLLGPSIASALGGSSLPVQWTGRVHGGPAHSADTAHLIPVRHLGDDVWQAQTGTGTAHLAGLIGCDGIAVMTTTTGAVSDRVEILPIPTR